MGSGWAYFVEQRAYEVHVRKHFDDTEVSEFLNHSRRFCSLTDSLDRDLRINFSCRQRR